jgi:cyanophycinase-like exopeptidase
VSGRAARPRLLAIMGSGETAPTMVKVHRELLSRLESDAGGEVEAVLLDTPYGFQENADIISARAVDYFRESVGRTMEVASWRSVDEPAITRESALARVGRAGYVFAGPGSPTYALAQWTGTPLPSLLAQKLASGGCVTFASAAALTLGVVTVPVYEIYKVGGAVRWEPGLNLLAATGIHAAVIPHYDNSEGGNHDTRFCYLGERRLRMLEEQLPDGAFVLGVDEHTALVMDLTAGTATVSGHGGVTVRRAGADVVIASGEEVPIAELARGVQARGAHPAPAGGDDRDTPAVTMTAPGLLADAERLEREMADAIAAGDAGRAMGAVLELEAAIVDWSRDTLQSDETDRARVVLRRMIVRLGELAEEGAADPAARVAPFVEAVLAAREGARAAKDYALADELRDRLVAAGIEVRDSPDGTSWSLPGG